MAIGQKVPAVSTASIGSKYDIAEILQPTVIYSASCLVGFPQKIKLKFWYYCFPTNLINKILKDWQLSGKIAN